MEIINPSEKFKVHPLEKFSTWEAEVLRNKLIHVDTKDAIDMVASFLSGRGYGAGPEVVQDLIKNVKTTELEDFKKKLEAMALAN